MKAQFTFISGARAGQTDVFSQAHLSIGRHPQSELRFDADQDLDVSSRHASVTLVGEFYILRDLGSTNGTFVNGKKLTGDHMLATRDVIRFGPSGPQVEFTAIGDPRPAPGPAPAAKPDGTVVFGQQPAAPPPPPPPQLSPEQLRSPRRTPGPGTQTKVRMEVRRQTKGLRTTTIGLFALLVVLSGAYLWQVRAADQALADQRRALLGQVDSLMQEIGAIAQGNEGLRAALDSSQAEAERLRQLLANAPDEDRMAELRARLEQALRQQRSLAGAASVDARGIAAANRDAIALVFVEFPDGRVITGTAFAVRSDPNGGLLITNKHVVVDSNGTVASRLGVVFEGSRQNFRADLVRVSPDADVALIRASVHRGFPVVKSLADSGRVVEVGEPSAVLGFPLGLDLAGGRDWSQIGVASTLTLGTVSRTLPDLVQLDSYGAQGASGSPIFDRNGNVVAVLYGGQPGSNGRILYGVPIRFAHRLLSDNE
ncbi:MAG: trypsin-like peptidase domain-containing protein [Gemmatimonadetes bacterium]|nr:trypsin-like peptidase domain-containing protein [Gemmatimonadota bacterium]